MKFHNSKPRVLPAGKFLALLNVEKNPSFRHGNGSGAGRSGDTLVNRLFLTCFRFKGISCLLTLEGHIEVSPLSPHNLHRCEGA